MQLGPVALPTGLEEITTPITLNISEELLDFFVGILQKPSLSSREVTVNILGVATGCLSVAFALPYGYTIGADNLGITSPIGKQVAGWYIAVVGTLALAALTGRITGDSWVAIIRGRAESEINVSVKFNYTLKQLADVLCFNIIPIALAILSTAPNIYITETSFSKYNEGLAIFLDIFAFLGMATTRSWALKTVFSNIYNEIKYSFLGFRRIRERLPHDSLLYKKLVIRDRLQENKNLLLSLEMNEIDQIFSAIMQPSETNAESLRRLQTFLCPVHVLSNQPQIYKESWPSYIFRNLGSLIALIGPYPAYVLAGKASDAFWDLLDVQNKAFLDFSSVFFGVSAWIAIGCLSAIATNDTFSKFYMFFMRIFHGILSFCSVVASMSKSQIINILFYSLFAILALSSAAPKAEIAITTVNTDFFGVLVIISTVISAFSNDFWAWTSLREEKCLEKPKNEILLKNYNMFISKINNFEPQHIDYLFDIVSSTLTPITQTESTALIERTTAATYRTNDFNQDVSTGSVVDVYTTQDRASISALTARDFLSSPATSGSTLPLPDYDEEESSRCRTLSNMKICLLQ